MSYVVINEMTTLSFRNAFLKQEGFRAVLTIHRRPVPSTCIAHQVAKELYGRHRKDARKASTVLREDLEEHLPPGHQRRIPWVHAHRPYLFDLSADRHPSRRSWHHAAPAAHRLVQQALQLHHGRHGHHGRRHHCQELYGFHEPSHARRQGAQRRLHHGCRPVQHAAARCYAVHHQVQRLRAFGLRLHQHGHARSVLGLYRRVHHRVGLQILRLA